MKVYRNMDVQNALVKLNSGVVSVPGRAGKTGGVFMVQEKDLSSPELEKKIKDGTICEVTSETKAEVLVDKKLSDEEVEESKKNNIFVIVPERVDNEHVMNDSDVNNGQDSEVITDDEVVTDGNMTADILTNSSVLVELEGVKDETGDQSLVTEKKKKKTEKSSNKK